MKKIAESAVKLLRDGADFALATILSSSGSTPRESGAGMIVRADGTAEGTAGGGVLEANILNAAKKVLANRASAIEEYALESEGEKSIGAVCGGRVAVLIEHIDSKDGRNLEYFEALLRAARSESRAHVAVLIPDSGPMRGRCQCLILPDGSIAGGEIYTPEQQKYLLSSLDTGAGTKSDAGTAFFFPVGADGTVYIFGAGHCGQKLAHVLHTIGFATVVIDDRSEFANPERFPEADEIIVPKSMVDPFDTIDFGPNSYIVIVTRGHAHDEVVLRRALKTSAGYIGMMGSRTKRDAIYQRMMDDGFKDEDFDRVYCPIGLSIGAETPEEIAVSIAAELIKVRSRKRS